jgi:peptidoglycan/xylan/chitin deacetylase (PgdA/CDA1 family)
LLSATTIRNAVTRAVVFDRARKTSPGPIASFTFDDFPRSAWTRGGPILERYGAKSTYYAAGRFCGLQEDGLEFYDAGDLHALHAAGHEIGCHTFSHRPASEIAAAALAADMERNRDFIRRATGVEMTTFAYPYGHVTLGTKRMAGRRYDACRGYRWGVNRETFDRGELLSVHLELRSWSATDVEARVQAARRSAGWLVFVSHDVSDSPTEYGTTPEMLEHALRSVRDAGFDVLTVRDALAHAVRDGHG